MSATHAAAVALGLLVAFGLLGFGWRAWLQRRRTGSTGVHGVSGPIGSVEWLAGAGFVAAMVVAGLGPLLQFLALVAPLPIGGTMWLDVTGIAVATVGIALTVWAQLAMGHSWRIGVDPSETTALVHAGVFGVVRNPIYTAMLVFEIGIALLATNVVTLTGLVLAFAALELQVRRVEEPYLAATHGSAYHDYTARVGRFLPGVGRSR